MSNEHVVPEDEYEYEHDEAALEAEAPSEPEVADAPTDKPDPLRPYKAYAGLVSAFLTSLLANTALDMPPILVALLSATVAAIAVFLTPNPTV